MMVAPWRAVVLAQAAAGDPFQDLLLWAALALAVIILFGVVVLVWLNHWRKRAGLEPLTANDQLAHFRELYDQGELSQEEFERIRAALTPQLQQELGLIAAPAPPGSQGQPPSGKEGETCGPPEEA